MSEWFRTYGLAEVHEDLIIGALPLDGEDVAVLAELRVERVLNLVEDQEYPPGRRAEVQSALERSGITEQRMNLTDFGRLPTDRLELAVTQVVGWLKEGRVSYVHCRAGWQRSAAVAAGAVAVRDGLSIDDALRYVQWRRPSADPLPHQRADLWDWWKQRSGLHRR